MSEKKRINQIAKETGLSNADLVAKAQELGMNVKAHSSSVTDEEAKQLASSFGKSLGQTEATEKVAEKPAKVSKKSTSKSKEQAEPRVFAGKAVVEDPAILARIKAKEEAEKLEAAQKVAVESEKVEAPVAPVETKVEVKSEAQVTETKKLAVEAKTETKVQEKAPVAHSEDKAETPIKKEEEKKKSTLTGRPRIQIKVVKKAEDIKKEAAKTEKKNFDRNNNRNNQNRDNRPGNRQGGQGGGQRFNNNNSNGGQNRPNNKFGQNNAAPAPTTDTFTPAAGKNTRRDREKKKGDNSSNSNDREKRAGGPLRVNDNRNQVRNARNSNWNNGRGGRNRNNRNQQFSAPVTQRKFHELPEELEYEVGMNVQDIAKSIKREPAEIIKKLFMMGTMVNQNQSLDEETIELILMDYGITPVAKVEEDKSDIERLFVEEGYLNEENMVERPAVVTIMGHVDHGKTTLLDRFRESRVTEGEAGGITQHIGAYQIVANGKKITFLDTPGHEAFTSMRARGASVTDITILVVAADDGVMPQTIEAINHSKAAGVPIIVAINKIDKPGANPQRVIQELSEHGVMQQAWGGESEFVEISAKFNQNLSELLDTVLLVSEMQELKADPTVRAIGTVVEARLDQGKGAIATLLVQQGTLRIQDPIVVGNTYGRVRTMTNDLGRRIKEATPSTPIELTGLSDVPQAGDHFAVFEDEKSARSAGEERAKRAQLIKRQNTRRVSLDNLFDTLKEGQVKTVNLIIKADVQGSAEALAASLQKIDVAGVKVEIVHNAVGAISESDISLAEASGAIIVGFNVRPTGIAREMAERGDVDIRLHSIIYKVIDEIETAMKGMLDPEFKEEIIGEALVRETFEVSKVGTIAGFLVLRGKVARDASLRVIREGVVIHDGAIASLKHFKDDVKEVGNAQEGGLMIDNYNDVAVDDTFEIYKMVEIKR